VQESDGVITWNGAVSAGQPVAIQFDAAIPASLTSHQPAVNIAEISDGLGNNWQRQAVTFINGFALYLPQVNR
jgi:hypothetical protein